ncbi:MAG: hypothetical protein ACRECV_19925 [Xanthobacteraceae bacterium]
MSLFPRAIALVTTIQAKRGERVIAKFDRLGKLDGVVMREMERGFVMSVRATREEREKLADRIEWLEKHKNHDVSDRRGDDRIVPKNPFSRMILPDGSGEACLVLDFSATGAAVSADTVPPVGMVLAIGLLVCRVVRHFNGGFAVRYVQQEDPSTVEAMVIHK